MIRLAIPRGERLPARWRHLASRRSLLAAGADGDAGRFIITVLSGTALARLVAPLGDGQDVLVEARRQPGTGKLPWVILDGERCRAVELAIARLAAEFGVIYRPRAGGTATGAE